MASFAGAGGGGSGALVTEAHCRFCDACGVELAADHDPAVAALAPAHRARRIQRHAAVGSAGSCGPAPTNRAQTEVSSGLVLRAKSVSGTTGREHVAAAHRWLTCPGRLVAAYHPATQQQAEPFTYRTATALFAGTGREVRVNSGSGGSTSVVSPR